MILLTLFCSLLAATVSGQEVQLEGLGKLKGKEDIARDGTRYFSFTGVPYAQPPVGDLRFNLPVAVESWEGVKDATNYGSKCMQYPGYNPGTLVGNEDCLFLNIHTKNIGSSVKRPVIVWIHGGAFKYGSANKLEATYLLEQDIVLVSIQYRLGPFGFLTTQDKAAPGNYGLHDQHAALQFVQKHIKEFGGDENMVTIMGLSAGGASVHYHVLSPKSEGLFHRAVAFSGTALCWWANLPTQGKTTARLADMVGCSSSSSVDTVDCLRTKTATEIMAAQDTLYAWRSGKVEAEPMNIWSPRSDPEAGQENAILPIDPTLAMEVGMMQPVPFLIGVANSEGIWRANNYISQDEVMSEFLKDFSNVAPWALGLVDQVADHELEDVVEKMKKFYLSDPFKVENVEERLTKVITGLQNMLGDSMFNYPIDRTIKLSANKAHAPVWLYEFNYKHNHSLARFNPKMQLTHPGAVYKPEEVLQAMNRPTHAQELAMLFPMFNEDMGPHSEEEEKYSKKFVRFVTDFAREGDPAKFSPKIETKDWKPMADGQISHYVFGKYSSTSVGFPFQFRMKWWNSLPVYWKKNKNLPASPEEDDETQDGAKQDGGERYAEDAQVITEAEELTEAEVIKVEEAEAERLLNSMNKEEL